MSTILAIDYGLARIGLAISYHTLAEPLKVIKNDLTANNQIIGSQALQEIKSIIEKEKVDPRYLCQGHDLVNFIVIILPEMLKSFINKDDKTKFARTKDKINNENKVREKLILGYEMAYFKRTRTYSKIKRLVDNNQLVSILQE